MTNKKNILVITILLLLIFLMTGCHGILPKPTKGVITGKVLIPPVEEELPKDISGWVPVANAEVTLRGADGVLHKTYTNDEGIFNFENLAVKANSIITATVKINGKTMVLKKIIPDNIGKEDEYDAGILTPESTALALVVERLIKDGKDIDLEKIKKANSFDNLVNEINGVLEEHGNASSDKDVKDLIDKIMEELFPGGGEDPVVEEVNPVTIATDPTDVTGLSNDEEIIVTLSTTTNGADIYYTLDNTNPSSSSTKYSTPFTVKTNNPGGETVTVKAIGIKSGYDNSTVSDKNIVFKAKIYTVTFETDGGTGVSPLTNVVHNSTISAPTPPTKTGYDFDGWYKEGALTNLWNFATDTVTADITLYAKWTAQSNIAYKVEHYQQNVAGTTYTLADTDNLTGTTGETVTATPKTYTGFTENTTHPDRVPSGTVLADGSLILKLYYDRNTYTVSFNSNGGSAVSPISGVRYGATIGAPTPPTRTGYDFNGWYSGSEAWDFATDTVTDNITLYAIWVGKHYTVTFDKNHGGTGGVPSTPSQQVQYGSQYGYLATVSDRTGYTFGGWFTEPDGGTEVTPFTTVNIASDHTLYAHWTAQSNIAYKVEHYQQNVTGTTYTLADTDNLTGTTGETVSATPKTYTGFTENTTHPDRVPSGTVLADGSLILKLYYDRNTYTVSFNSNGGSAVSPISGVRYGATIGAPAAPTRTGYDFDGWYKEGALTNLWNFSTDTVTADITLYAKWTATAVNVIVTFNPNGGAVTPTSKTVTVGSAYGELPTPTRVGTGIGYRFDGWYTRQNGGTHVTAATTVTNNSNHTLYARWSTGLTLSKPQGTSNVVQNSVGDWDTSAVTINSSDVNSWVQHGSYLDIRVIDSFPTNLTSLTFTRRSNQNRNQLQVTGLRPRNRTVNNTPIRVEVRLRTDNSVVATFVVTVSGSGNNTTVTCNVSIP